MSALGRRINGDGAVIVGIFRQWRQAVPQMGVAPQASFGLGQCPSSPVWLLYRPAISVILTITDGIWTVWFIHIVAIVLGSVWYHGTIELNPLELCVFTGCPYGLKKYVWVHLSRYLCQAFLCIYCHRIHS